LDLSLSEEFGRVPSLLLPGTPSSFSLVLFFLSISSHSFQPFFPSLKAIVQPPLKISALYFSHTFTEVLYVGFGSVSIGKEEEKRSMQSSWTCSYCWQTLGRGRVAFSLLTFILHIK
jgi:hypothetical protein